MFETRARFFLQAKGYKTSRDNFEDLWAMCSVSQFYYTSDGMEANQ